MPGSRAGRHGIEEDAGAPACIRMASGLAWVFVLLSLANAALSFLYLDDLVTATMESGGPEVTEGTARASAIVGIVLGLAIAALWAFLAVLLRRGANWARIGLSALAGVGVLLGIFTVLGPESREHTALFVVGVVSVVVQAAVLLLMWRRAAGRYLITRPAP